MTNQFKVETKSQNIIDEPIPEINIPILKPAPYRFNPPSLKSIVLKTANIVKEKINNFSDWIISYFPKSVFKVIDERIELLKEDIKNIYENKEKSGYKAKLIKTALKGFLKTYRIDGIKYKEFYNGIFVVDKENSSKYIYSWPAFLSKNKKKVINLIKKQNKPIKLKLIFTCNFVRMAVDVEDETSSTGYFHTKTEMITEATDLNELYKIAIENLAEKISKFTNSGSGWKFNNVDHLIM